MPSSSRRLRKSHSTGNLEEMFVNNEKLPVVTPTAATTVNKNKNRRSKSNKNGRKPARRSVSDDTHETHLIVSIGDFDKELPPKSETEMMAEIFKTANDLEDLAKRARRKARRRKTTHTCGARQSRRRSSSNVSLGDLPTAADVIGSSAPEANEVQPDCDERSVGSSRSNFSLSGLFAPSKRRGSNESSSRSLTGMMRRGLRRSKSQPKMEDSSNPSDLEDSFNSREGQPLQQSQQEQPPVCHFQINPEICKPSYYHDSDDDDDDLILDPDQDLDEYSKQVQNEVMNMTININWTKPTLQAAS